MTRAAVQPLLDSTCERSDGSVAGPSGITVMVETLAPVRGHAVTALSPQLTVAELKRLYLALALSESQSGGLEVRLILDGTELDDASTLQSCGVVDGMKLCAVLVRPRRGLCACVQHWWALGAVLLLWAALYWVALAPPRVGGAGALSGPTAQCAWQLELFLYACGPLLLPYGLVIAGRFQEWRGRRLLWFLRHSSVVSALVPVTVLLSLVWLGLGASWLFASGCDSASELYDTATAAWALLLLLNVPCLVVVVLPPLLMCRSPLAFALISCLSGAQGGTMQH